MDRILEKKQGAWCYYDNDSLKGKIHGRLYNWYAITDPRGIAPIGWHIPSHKEWQELIQYLGGGNIAGKKMKSLTGWDISNGTNVSGFNALPDGTISNGGGFYQLGKCSYWWSSSSIDVYNAWCHGLNGFKVDDDFPWECSLNCVI